MTPCPGRHHDFDESQTPPVCRKCGEPKKAPGRPKGSKTQKTAGAAVAGRLAGTLGIPAPPPRSGGNITDDANATSPGAVAKTGAAAGPPVKPPTAPPDGAAGAGASPTAPAAAQPTPTAAAAEEKPAPSLKPKGWCRAAGKKIAKLFDYALDAIAEHGLEKEANDADEDDLKEFAEGVGEQLAIWFPDMELTPGKKILIAGVAIVAEKYVGMEDIPRKPPSIAPKKLELVSPSPPSPPPLPAIVRGAPAAATSPPGTDSPPSIA